MILSILNNLASNNSRKFKLSVLQLNTDNQLLKRVVEMACNPMLQFYIRKIPKYKPLNNPTQTLEQALNDLSLLSTREKTGNAAIEHLRSILSNLSPDDAKVIERVIKKDLRCGVSTATINDAWKDLIPVFPCMRTHEYDENLVQNFRYPAWVQDKHDGMRFNAIVQNNTCEFRSRSGNLIELHGHLQEEFVAMAKGNDVVFDGEFLVRKNGVFLDRKTGNGILNKAVKQTITKEEASLVSAILWDYIPFKDWQKHFCEIDYFNRYKKLKDCVPNHFKSDDCRIFLSENIVVNNIQEVTQAFNKSIENNKEGIILKALNCGWENKRIKGAIKFKSEKECDLIILRIIPGEGKYDGLLGAIECGTIDEMLTVRVGSGFSDDQRRQNWAEKIGKIATIKYNEKIQSKITNKFSLFLPRFVEIRNDKTESNLIEEIN